MAAFSINLKHAQLSILILKQAEREAREHRLAVANAEKGDDGLEANLEQRRAAKKKKLEARLKAKQEKKTKAARSKKLRYVHQEHENVIFSITYCRNSPEIARVVIITRASICSCGLKHS